jgi:hypothetical protein
VAVPAPGALPIAGSAPAPGSLLPGAAQAPGAVPVGLPPVADPAKNIAALGALGGVLDLVNNIHKAATPPVGAPDLGLLQKLLDQLKAVIQGLLNLLPPLLSSPSVGTEPRTLPDVAPLPQSPKDALAKVQQDANALVAAATAAKPDPAAVKNAIAPLSTDTVAATAATTTALAPAP